jgi:hypothetical protein
MIQTKYGTFNGDTWEDLCQLVFKLKYGEANYQEMPASPGDFGIEGVIKNTGVAFQCYCPDNHYTQEVLYDKQRDKITEDLGKLKKFKDQIACRLGPTKISEWVFLTPQITDNKLLKHAQKKQDEVREWCLPILASDFKVILKDADFFASEIHTVQSAKGVKLVFLSSLELSEGETLQDSTEYEVNISRKNTSRCTFGGELNLLKHVKLNQVTVKKWIEGDSLLKRIEKDASDIYFQIMRVVNQYEAEVDELSITWQGAAEELVSRVRNELGGRLTEALPSLGEAERYAIADQMTSKWLALCPLEIE